MEQLLLSVGQREMLVIIFHKSSCLSRCSEYKLISNNLLFVDSGMVRGLFGDCSGMHRVAFFDIKTDNLSLITVI